MIGLIWRDQYAGCGQSPKAPRRGRASGKAPAPGRGKFHFRRRAHIAPAIEITRQNNDAEQPDPSDEHSDRQKVTKHVSGERGIDEIDEHDRVRLVKYADPLQQDCFFQRGPIKTK